MQTRVLAGAALVIAAGTLMVGTMVIPMHVSFGGGSLRCGTVLHPDRSSLVRAYCPRAGAHQLRGTLGLSAALAFFALMPLAMPRAFERRRAVRTGWAVGYLVVVIVGTTLLAMLEYAPPGRFFDL